MIQRFETFQTSIQQIYAQLQRVKTVGMQEFGLQASHVMCLYELDRHEEGMTAAELANACELNKAAISRSVKVLKDKGYVSVSSVLESRSYRAKIILTEAGMQVAARMNEKIVSITQMINNQIGTEELDHLYVILRQISGLLKNASDLPGIAQQQPGQS